MRKYSSFEEIEKDLKILKLQTEIDKEEVKLSLDQTKGGVSPTSLISDAFGSLLQKAIVLKAASKIFGLKKMLTSSKRS